MSEQQPPISKLWRLGVLAKESDVPKQSIHSAAGYGNLRTWATACGLRLTTLDEFQRWLDNPSDKAGRPRKY